MGASGAPDIAYNGESGPPAMHTLDLPTESTLSQPDPAPASLASLAGADVEAIPSKVGPMLGSLGLSLLFHGLLVAIFAVATLAVISEPDDQEFTAELIDTPR